MDSKTLFKTVFALALLTAAIAVSGAGAATKTKIVTLTPFSSNALVNSGVKPVAIGKQAVGHKASSPKLKGIQQLMLSHPNGPNMEQIAKIDPDVVLTAPAWKKGSQTMRDLGAKVYERDPATVNQVVARIKTIGNAYGSRKKTASFAKRISGQINYAKTGGKKITSHPSVLLLLGVGRSPQAFMPNTWGGSVVTAAGGKLITGGVSDSSGFARISDEAIIAANPEIIIAVPHGNKADIPSIKSFYETNPAWSTLDAVKSGKVFVITDDALLQPDTDAGNTIKRVRTKFLKNW